MLLRASGQLHFFSDGMEQKMCQDCAVLTSSHPYERGQQHSRHMLLSSFVCLVSVQARTSRKVRGRLAVWDASPPDDTDFMDVVWVSTLSHQLVETRGLHVGWKTMLLLNMKTDNSRL